MVGWSSDSSSDDFDRFHRLCIALGSIDYKVLLILFIKVVICIITLIIFPLIFLYIRFEWFHLIWNGLQFCSSFFMLIYLVQFVIILLINLAFLSLYLLAMVIVLLQFGILY